jgi:pimeloyl-ACP methyl ester carboxylesterase
MSSSTPAWQRWLREHLPGAEIHLFDTGHFALEENLPEIAPLIAAFLEKTYSTDPAPQPGVTARER